MAIDHSRTIISGDTIMSGIVRLREKNSTEHSTIFIAIIIGIVAIVILAEGVIVFIKNMPVIAPFGRKYVSYAGSMPLDYNTVASINFTKAKNILEQKGYEVSITPHWPWEDYLLWATMNLNGSRSYPRDIRSYIVAGQPPNKTKGAELFISYEPYRDKSNPHQWPENIDDGKQFTIAKAKEVADACELTIDWTKFEIVVSYHD